MKKLVLLILISIVACKKAEKKTDEDSKIINKQVVKKSTFYTTGDCVLFLKPSEEYFKTHLKDEEGIVEVDGDFNYYANEFYKEQKDNYKIYFVEQRLLAVINTQNDTLFIDRDKEKLNYGVVIQQNDSIQILKGVNTDIDVKMALGIFNPNEIK